MSIILDALRKVERERPALPQTFGIDRRVRGNRPAGTGVFFRRRHAGAMATGALAAIAGGFFFAAGMAGRNPLDPAAAEAMTRNETAVTVSTAVGARDGARHAEEEPYDAVIDPVREQGAGPLDGRGEISSRITAGPILTAPENRIEPRGTEPPVGHASQAAPAPVILLDGIAYHDDPDKRAALIRPRGGEGVLLNIGGRMRGFRVSAIGRSGVTLAAPGGKKIELALD